MSVYKKTFFIVPAHIIELPGLDFSYLRVYETIFEFWNHDKPCFLTNGNIMKRAKVEKTTLSDAILFFEKHGQLKRKNINGKRFLIRPENSIELGVEEGTATAVPPYRHSGTPPTATAVHNNINNNPKNSKREDTCSSSDEPVVDNFSVFWNLGLPKVARKPSEAKFRKLSKKLQKIIISDIPKRFANNWKGRPAGKIPHPLTYLNQERWNDELIPYVEPKKNTFQNNNNVKHINHEKIRINDNIQLLREQKSEICASLDFGHITEKEGATRCKKIDEEIRSLQRQVAGEPDLGIGPLAQALSKHNPESLNQLSNLGKRK